MSGPSSAQPDVTLLMDADGVIQKATVSKQVARENIESWVGRRWEETVGGVGSDKIRRMIQDAKATGVSSFRQVTQLFPSGFEMPMEYTTVRLAAKGGLMAVGKSLRAVAELQSRLISTQQKMERDYWKLRDFETRYKHLLEVSDEPVLVLNSTTLRIIDANPAAQRLLSNSEKRKDDLTNRDITADLSAQERNAFNNLLRVVRENGKAPAIVLHLGRTGKRWVTRTSLMKADQSYQILVRLTPVGGALQGTPAIASQSVDDFIEHLPDGFVVIDQDAVIKSSNIAFRELVEATSKAQVVGQRLSRWMWRPGADIPLLISNVRRHDAVRLYSTTIHGEMGTETDVEISAVGSPPGKSESIALLVRDVSRRMSNIEDNNRLLSAIGPISEQIGRTSLRNLVDDTTSVVERHYVKAALDLAGGNRTAAAELLGLSRQSLYTKLKRYHLEGEKGPDDETRAGGRKR
ncbi:MAG: transcriptional regulator PpsR [Hyphomicrobiales bacterium]|nr:MAG: transcriptional regulator PpsR [Hyphomicrobiales bacterium]